MQMPPRRPSSDSLANCSEPQEREKKKKKKTCKPSPRFLYTSTDIADITDITAGVNDITGITTAGVGQAVHDVSARGVASAAAPARALCQPGRHWCCLQHCCNTAATLLILLLILLRDRRRWGGRFRLGQAVQEAKTRLFTPSSTHGRQSGAASVCVRVCACVCMRVCVRERERERERRRYTCC